MSTQIALLVPRLGARAGVRLLGGALAVSWGALAASSPLAALGLAALVAVLVTSFLRPAAGAYLLVAVTPLVAGMNRGTAIPFLRPSEALTILIALPVIARRVAEMSATTEVRLRASPSLVAMVALMVTGSLLPLAWLFLRGQRLTQDNVLYSFQILKYLGVYLVVRAGIRTPSQVRRCLVACVAVGAIVAVIGILQALKAFGVPQLLASHWSVNGQADLLAINRASSTLSDSFSMADVMVFDLAIVAALMLRPGAHRLWLALAGLLFLAAGLASGELSGAIGLIVGVGAVGWLTGRMRRSAGVLAVACLVGLVALGPVIHQRLSPTSGTSFQSSWHSRVHNLETYVLPPLTTDFHYVLGVRPEARIPVVSGPDKGDVIYIESGYLWLLWVGGIPYLLAFLGFCWSNLGATRRLARRPDAIGAAATAGFAALAVEGVLMVLDPHLTLRGAGDLLFTLLALACARDRQPAPAKALPPAPVQPAAGMQPAAAAGAHQPV